MKLYCVRHGESEGNARRVHQPDEVSLTDIGVDQARYVAHRFSNISIDVIISSPIKRALQTAEIIQQKINKPLEVNELIREVVRPKEIINKRFDDPTTFHFFEEMAKHRLEPKWHYADAENYYDLFIRAKEFLKLIESRQEKNILLVSHAMFYHMLMTAMTFPDELDLPLFERITYFFYIRNTGITVYERQEKGWRLLTWNDYAHLE